MQQYSKACYFNTILCVGLSVSLFVFSVVNMIKTNTLFSLSLVIKDWSERERNGIGLRMHELRPCCLLVMATSRNSVINLFLFSF